MGVIGRPLDEAAIGRKLEDMQRQITALQNASRIGNTAIDGGDLTIKGGALRLVDEQGKTIVYIGRRDDDLGSFAAIIFTRPDGSYTFTQEREYWSLNDQQNNVVFSDDAVSGQGIARPYIPSGRFVDAAQYSGALTATTASTGFVDLQSTAWTKQHPRVRLFVIQSTGSTTAEWRVMQNDSNEVFRTTTNSGSGWSFWEFPIDGGWLSWSKLTIQGRVASGAGTIGVRVLSELGIQS